jgi:hypothetical protein
MSYPPFCLLVIQIQTDYKSVIVQVRDYKSGLTRG